MQGTPNLDRLWRSGRNFLQVSFPILCGAMTWVSDHSLVAAVSNAGGFGILAAGNMAPEELEKEIALTRAATANPFGVNLITIAPRYKEHLDLVTRLGLPFVVFAGSFPRKAEIQKVKEAGGKVMTFASTDSIARQMIGFGTDALILEGFEAGGHIGHVALSILLQEVLFRTDQVPVFVAGGIATGQMMAHLLLMGAAGVQLGTLFALSEECRAHPAFKEAFRKARAREAVATPQYDSRLPVVAVRALRNKAHDAFGQLQLRLLAQMDAGVLSREKAQYEVENFWVGSLRRAVMEGDVEHGSLMAGQSVGLVGDIKPVACIIADLRAEAEETLGKVKSRLADGSAPQ